MKRTVVVLLAVFSLVLGSALPGEARGGGHFHGGGHGHGHFGVDVMIGPGFFDPWWGYPYGYPYPYAAPPVVIQSQPDVYLEQPAPEPQYWYYCSESNAYYPYVKRCPSGWKKVVPQAPGRE